MPGLPGAPVYLQMLRCNSSFLPTALTCFHVFTLLAGGKPTLVFFCLFVFVSPNEAEEPREVILAGTEYPQKLVGYSLWEGKENDWSPVG